MSCGVKQKIERESHILRIPRIVVHMFPFNFLILKCYVMVYKRPEKRSRHI